MTTPLPDRTPFGTASSAGLLAEAGKTLAPRALEPDPPAAPNLGLRARLRFRNGHRAQLVVPPGAQLAVLTPPHLPFRMPPAPCTADDVLAAYVADLSARHGLLVELVFDEAPTRDELLTENTALRAQVATLTGRG